MATTASEWPLKRLKNITSKIGSGATPRGGKNGYRAEGISLIRSLNVYDFSFTEEDLAFIGEEQAAELDNVIVEKDDILLNITGASVARCCLTNPKFLPARVNQHVAIVRIRPDVADARFVLYCINSPHFKNHLLALAQGGATREALTKTTIEDFEVWQPLLQVQRRIADILSAYDDLIENNQRRIKILEEMARALYREWFVHFRFPGHESAKFVPSPLGKIPEGWEVKTLVDVCNLVMGQSPESKFYNETGEGLPFHQGVTNFGDRFPIDCVYCTVENRIAEKGDILFSVRAPVGRINIATKKIVIGRGVSAIRNKAGNQVFLFHQLKENFQEEDTMGGGTIFRAVTKDEMQRVKFVMPFAPLISKFEEVATPMSREIEFLTSKNANLRRTRDLLLPKLISGEVNV